MFKVNFAGLKCQCARKCLGWRDVNYPNGKISYSALLHVNVSFFHYANYCFSLSGMVAETSLSCICNYILINYIQPPISVADLPRELVKILISWVLNHPGVNPAIMSQWHTERWPQSCVNSSYVNSFLVNVGYLHSTFQRQKITQIVHSQLQAWVPFY